MILFSTSWNWGSPEKKLTLEAEREMHKMILQHCATTVDGKRRLKEKLPTMIGVF